MTRFRITPCRWDGALVWQVWRITTTVTGRPRRTRIAIKRTCARAMDFIHFQIEQRARKIELSRRTRPNYMEH